jgi:hypothetical protein
MAKGHPRGSAERALIRSAELMGWALGGIEREIVETRNRLAALTAQAAKLRKQAGRKTATAAATTAAPKTASRRRKRRMSAEGRKRIAEAAKRRWAAWRADNKGGKS